MQKHTFRAFNCSESGQKTAVADENEPVRVVQHLISCPSHARMTPQMNEAEEERMQRVIEKLLDEMRKQVDEMVSRVVYEGIVSWRFKGEDVIEFVRLDG